MQRLSSYRSAVFARDGFICAYCGKTLSRETATLDHVEPLCNKGRSHPDNLVVACQPCNLRKGSLTLTAFLLGDPFPMVEAEPCDKVESEIPQMPYYNGTRYRRPKQRKIAPPREPSKPSLFLPIADLCPELREAG